MSKTKIRTKKISDTLKIFLMCFAFYIITASFRK